METVLRIALIGIMAAIFALSVRKHQPEMALQLGIVAGLVIFIHIVEYLAEAVDFLRAAVSRYDIPVEGVSILLKIIGIAYICEFSVQILKDAGENAVASKVELAGRVVIVAMTLPLITGFIDMILAIA